MFPFIFKHGEFVIQTFSFMLMVASLVATLIIYKLAPKKGLSQIAILDIGIIGTLSAIVGMRIFHVLVEYPSYYWEDPWRVFQIWKGGFVSYGAVIGITVSVFIYLRIKKLPFWPYCDLVALIGPVINFIVRIGCLGAGCCYGRPTDSFLHLTFTNPASDAGHKFPGIPLHPTQIYDLLLNGVWLFIVLIFIYRRKKFEGQVTASFFMFYAVQRAFVEFFRGDADRGVYFGGLVSTAQVTGIFAFLFGLFLYVYLSKRKTEMDSISPSNH